MKSKCHLKKLQRAETDVQCDCDQNGLTMTYVKASYYILVCMAADTGLYLDVTGGNTVSLKLCLNMGQDICLPD